MDSLLQTDEKYMRMAIIEAQKAFDSDEVPIGAVIVAGGREPCVMCAGAIAWSQISRVVYGAADAKRGYSRFGNGLLHPRTEVTAGVLAAESEKLMTDFFAKLR